MGFGMPILHDTVLYMQNMYNIISYTITPKTTHKNLGGNFSHIIPTKLLRKQGGKVTICFLKILQNITSHQQIVFVNPAFLIFTNRG